jgi:hypothetical protein
VKFRQKKKEIGKIKVILEGFNLPEKARGFLNK